MEECHKSICHMYLNKVNTNHNIDLLNRNDIFNHNDFKSIRNTVVIITEISKQIQRMIKQISKSF